MRLRSDHESALAAADVHALADLRHALDADQADDVRGRLIGRLEQIREDSVHFLAIVDDAQRSLELQSAGASDTELEAKLELMSKLRDEFELREQPHALMRELEAYGCVFQDWAAGVRAIHDDLCELAAYWPVPEDIQAARGRLTSVRRLLWAVAVRAAELTVPITVNDRLRGYRVGKPLSFDREFEKELPYSKMRAEVFKRLVGQAGRIDGILDPDTRLIYKRSPNGIVRGLTYVAPVLLAVGGGAIMWLLSVVAPKIGLPDGWHLERSGELIGAYVLVLSGAVLHLLVASAKQAQIGAIRVTPIANTLDWLHLRWPSVAQMLFLTRFDATAGTGLKALRKAVAPGAKLG